MANSANPVYEFGPFRLDAAERLLLRAGHPVPLTPKAFDTLRYFVENHQRLLSKDELIAQLWPDSFVEESNLAQNVSAVRRALGEKPEGGQYIETVPKRGYRFVGEVTQSWEPARQSATAPALAPAGGEPQTQPAPPEPIPTSDEPAEEPLSATPVAESIVQAAHPIAATPPAGVRRYTRLWIGLGVLALLTVTLGILWQRQFRATQQAERPRLAVLPLRNLKPAPETDFLSFSLADAIITRLSYVGALTVRPSAVVAAAVTKLPQPEADPQLLAQTLDVDKLLTGTYLKEGDDLRIHLQLIDVPRQQVLWVQPLDLKYDRLLTVQDRVTQQVISGLHVTLTPVESDQLTRSTPSHPQAYESYLQGLAAYQAGEYTDAVTTLEKATALDANHASAWAHLGRAYTAVASFAFGGRALYEKAQAAYEKALALNPQEIEARIFLANLFTDTGRVEQAVPQLRAVLTTNPGHAEAHWELSYAYRFAGLLAESIAEGERARQLDAQVKLYSSAFNSYLYAGQYHKFLQSLPPGNEQAFIVFYRGFGHYYQNQHEEAARLFDHAYTLDPSLYTQVGKALSAGLAGTPAQGLTLLRDTERKLEERGVIEAEGTYKVAQAFAVLGEKEAALRLLRRSIEGGFFCYPYFVSDPLLVNLRAEPEFNRLLETAKQRHEAFKQQVL